MSILDILQSQQRRDDRFFGVITGVVTNNEDPDDMCRVKVKIPRISGDEESTWARVATFMAGKDRGAVFIPEVDDEVLIAFECGDVSQPFVIGSLFNGSDTPPQSNSDGDNNFRVFKSRSGHLITIDDTKDAEKISIVDKTEKNSITFDSSENTITIESDGDITLKASNGKVIIDAENVEITSSKATTIEVSSDLELKASQGALKVEAQDVKMKSTAATKIEATSEAEIKASGTMKIKGATIDLN
jgi:uncharacterized protein involved in type VI secretion and phage assembly